MTRLRRPLALISASVLSPILLVGCATHAEPPATAPADTAFPVTIIASGGTPVTLTARPKRIVSLSPASTEDLFAIGAGSQVTAVDKQSDHPADAPHSDLDAYKPNVEAIAGRNPDLVIAYYDTDNLVSGLEKLKVPVLVLPAATSLDEAYGQISLLGKATGHTGEADRLVGDMRSQIAGVVARTPKAAKPLSYFHEVSADGYTLTSKTFVGQVYGLFGLTNIADAAASAGDYPQLSAEQVIKSDPDLILLADTKCCRQSAATVAARPGWSTLKAVRTGEVVALDDDIASRWGPRVVDLVKTVAEAVTKASQQNG
jgi:iron complex transport system substrate-binding protein